MSVILPYLIVDTHFTLTIIIAVNVVIIYLFFIIMTIILMLHVLCDYVPFINLFSIHYSVL